MSNHAHVLLCLYVDPGSRGRDVASKVGITERAVQKIISDLETGGLIVRERVGRRNQYTLQMDQPLRHPLERGTSVRELVELLYASMPESEKKAAEAE